MIKDSIDLPVIKPVPRGRSRIGHPSAGKAIIWT